MRSQLPALSRWAWGSAGAVMTVKPVRSRSASGALAGGAEPAGTTARRSFQVLRVPQLSSVTLTAPVAPPAWNGETGGVLVLDVAGTINLNGQTITADATGFRGGGSFVGGSLTGQGVTDYANTYVPTTSTTISRSEEHTSELQSH